jgi:ribosomal protein S18 acetylase RimI-like enzyme
VLEVLNIYEGLGFTKLLRLPGYLHDSTESLMVNQLVIRQILSDQRQFDCMIKVNQLKSVTFDNE